MHYRKMKADRDMPRRGGAWTPDKIKALWEAFDARASEKVIELMKMKGEKSKGVMTLISKFRYWPGSTLARLGL